MFRKWFVRLHGEGEAHQPDLYRCIACERLVTWNKIRSGEVCRCGGKRIRPTNPGVVDAVRLFLLPWTI